MPILFKCPSCRGFAGAADHLAGRGLRCYQCQADFTVPATSEASSRAMPVDQHDTRPGFGSSSAVDLGL
jgi:hypothetical protein